MILGSSSSAGALPCVEDKFGAKVNCTANDIRITDITEIFVTDDGCQGLDDTVTFNATLTVVTTATARYDIGLFIGEDGIQAENGECSVFSLPADPDPPFSNLDSDECGDSESSTTLEVEVTGIVVDCVDANDDQQLDLATCTSWQQNSGGECGGADDVVPGTASKCNCPTTPTDIPIFVPDPVCITNADCEELATGCLTGVCDVPNPDASAFGCVFTPTDSLCDDDLFCNGDETCDEEGNCDGGTAPDCDDDVACTNDSCNEATDACVNTPDDDVCDDDLFCNGEETCDAENGCQAGTAPDCDDDVGCTNDSCSEAGDTCVSTPDDALCDDDLFCNGDETCDAEGGCQAGTAPDCDDDVACTNDACSEAADTCVQTPDDDLCDDDLFCNGEETCDAENGCQAGTAPDCDDDVACTNDACSEAGDTCVQTPDDDLCDDDLFCNGEETCDATQGCESGPAPVCDDGIPCTLDACNEDDNACTTTGNDLACNDQNLCTQDLCAPETGCEHIGLCEAGICRSAGFWSTHGGFEKNGDNILQDVLDAVGGLEVCGQEVTATSNPDRPFLEGLGLDSALEGLCVTTDGVKQRALYRQLLAAALNCAMSGSSDCDATVGEHTDVSFDECDALCAGDPVADGPTIGECTRALDCYNNGGEVIEGACALGNCSVTGDLCGSTYGGCPLVNDVPQECEAFPGNCHDAELCSEVIDVCPTSTGPASSSRACKEARDNDCTIDDCN